MLAAKRPVPHRTTSRWRCSGSTSHSSASWVPASRAAQATTSSGSSPNSSSRVKGHQRELLWSEVVVVQVGVDGDAGGGSGAAPAHSAQPSSSTASTPLPVNRTRPPDPAQETDRDLTSEPRTLLPTAARGKSPQP